jgi:hypothetical protein
MAFELGTTWQDLLRHARYMNRNSAFSEPSVEDYEKLMRETEPDDECPLCQCGTVEHIHGEIRCRGECGAVVQMVEADNGKA